MLDARLASMAKYPADDLGPLAYRVLLILPVLYKVWGKGKTNALAAMDCNMGIIGNICRGRGVRACGCGVLHGNHNGACSPHGNPIRRRTGGHVYIFHQAQRPILYELLREAVMPAAIIFAY